jgi:hypothetical protein
VGGEDQPVALGYQQTLSHHGLGAFAFGGAQSVERQPVAQPDFSQHAFGAHGVRAELLETATDSVAPASISA